MPTGAEPISVTILIFAALALFATITLRPATATRPLDARSPPTYASLPVQSTTDKPPSRMVALLWGLWAQPESEGLSSQRSVPLDALRLVAVALAALDAIGRDTSGARLLMSAELRRLADWGAAGIPLLFTISGFTFGARHQSPDQEDVWPILRRRLVEYLPAHTLVNLLALLLAHSWLNETITGWHVLELPFCFGAWHADARLNSRVNPLSWIVGALLCNTAIGLPALSRLVQCSSMSLLLLLLLCWACTAWQAAYDVQLSVFVLDRNLTFLAFCAHVPAFVSGLILAHLHVRRPRRPSDAHLKSISNRPDVQVDIPPTSWGFIMCGETAESCGLCAAVAACTIAFGLVELGEATAYVQAWVRCGLMLPLAWLAIWATATARKDPLCVLLLGVQCAAPALRLWMPLALCAWPSWRFLSAVTQAVATEEVVTEGVAPADLLTNGSLVTAYLSCLGCAVVTTEVFARRSCVSIMTGLIDAVTSEGRAPSVEPAEGRASSDKPQAAPKPRTEEERDEVSLWEQLAIYYGLMGLLVFVMIIDVGQAENMEWVWPSLRSMPQEAQDFLYGFSWLLALPTFALLMGIAGQILYPPVIRPNLTPISAQLTQSGEVGDEIILYWRIVTRGMHPDLVSMNAVEAHAVLSTCMPRGRWVVEVVTDTAMDIASRGGSAEIVEIVVPTEYKCPAGARFKAHTLHY